MVLLRRGGGARRVAGGVGVDAWGIGMVMVPVFRELERERSVMLGARSASSAVMGYGPLRIHGTPLPPLSLSSSLSPRGQVCEVVGGRSMLMMDCCFFFDMVGRGGKGRCSLMVDSEGMRREANSLWSGCVFFFSFGRPRAPSALFSSNVRRRCTMKRNTLAMTIVANTMLPTTAPTMAPGDGPPGGEGMTPEPMSNMSSVSEPDGEMFSSPREGDAEQRTWVKVSLGSFGIMNP